MGPGGLGEQKIECVLHATNISSRILLVNGKELDVGKSSKIPDVLQLGTITVAAKPLTLPPHSIIFTRYPNARLDECRPRETDGDDEGIKWAVAVEIAGVTVISFAVACTIFAACCQRHRNAQRYKQHTRISTEEQKQADEEAIQLSSTADQLDRNEL
mmetsp:Transcript_12459/g.23866  ORF Transcript_12459/g.23866 Transcript_12459/m.23866 type:complete len:158 (-) Transcript_12459:328-801(-)